MDIASWMMTAQTLEVVHDVDKRTKAIMDSAHSLFIWLLHGTKRHSFQAEGNRQTTPK